jgi:RHS repeat-associated protein
MVKVLVRLSILVILAITLVRNGHAETIVYGPKTFKVDKTQSLISNEVFSSPSVGSNFVLRVKNGDAAGGFLVTSGTITLNGTQVLSPSDLNQQVPLVELSPTILETNTLRVELSGKSGSYVTVTIVQQAGESNSEVRNPFHSQYKDLIPSNSTAVYDPQRFSLITGEIQDQSGAPLPGVTVSIAIPSCISCNGAQYGTVTTDELGQFTIPVNGGSIFTAVYKKEGFITSHRHARVGWNETAVVKPVQMITQDPVATTLTLNGNSGTVLKHKSSKITDQFGSRSATIVLTGDNRAYSVDASGNTLQEITTLTTRATEFTTPETMPAVLPPNSGYTYCAEFSVDGAERVRFDKAVITWVNNFLGFPVGGIVPVGYYDRDRGKWISSDNGVVVRLLDTNGDNIVDALDSDGDNLPDDLNGNGSFADEVAGLNNPVDYPPGATFWRVAVKHFTPWDYNWPSGPPADAIAPNPEGQPSADQQEDEENDCETEMNSFAEDRSRIFHEDFPITGADLNLHYASNRVRGYKTKVTVPVSGSTVPVSLKGIVAEMEVAGRVFTQQLAPGADQKAEFVWDGLDNLGKSAGGGRTASIRIGFVYQAMFLQPAQFSAAFAQFGGTSTGIGTRQDITIWKQSSLSLQATSGTIAEGWTLSEHHQADGDVLQKGNGRIMTNNIHIITRAAGVGTSGYSGDGGPAIDAQFGSLDEIAFNEMGELYIIDNDRIRKVDRNGIITTVVGNGREGFGGDGREAIAAKLNNPRDIAFDAEGNLYIADAGNDRIRKVAPNGIITTVVGNGGSGYSGDGGPALAAEVNSPWGLAIDSQGNLYIVSDYRIRKVDSNGIITTIAGDGSTVFSGDGGPAIEAGLGPINGITVSSSAEIYLATGYSMGGTDQNRIRKIDQNGTVTTVAGSGIRGYSGDGGPALQAKLNCPTDVALDAWGSLYIADYQNDRIRKVDRDGIITTVVGNGVWGLYGDGGAATQAALGWNSGIAFDASGNLYMADTLGDRIRKVSIGAGRYRENGLDYVISATGEHTQTVDLDTGGTLRSFGYNDTQQLYIVTDQFGDSTTINRDIAGKPTSITSPDGQITHLTIDDSNHLTRITYPDGTYYDFEYSPDGLLLAKTDPRSNRFEHIYDENGKLNSVSDPELGQWSFSKSISANGDILAEKTTGELNVTSYLDRTYSTGAYSSTITGPSGGVTTFDRSADGLSVSKSLACGIDLTFEYGFDPVSQFRFVKKKTESSQAGLIRITQRERNYQDSNANGEFDQVAEKTTVNGKTETLLTDKLLSRKEWSSPLGRKISVPYDPNTLNPLSRSIPGLYAVNYGWDLKGRLASITQNERQVNYTYTPEGFLDTVTDAETRMTTFDHDALGRVTGIHRPDNSLIGLSYDANGNVETFTTPFPAENHFAHNGVNRLSGFTSPLNSVTSYAYDKDRNLTAIHLPSGKTITNTYTDGRLSGTTTAEWTNNYTYNCGNRPVSISRGSEQFTFGYDGTLLTSIAQSGSVFGNIGFSYDNDFHLTAMSYGGSSEIFNYDNDGLLTAAGRFAVNRNVANGLPESITAGNFLMNRTFNGYGEVEAAETLLSGSSVFSYGLNRNNSSRITAKSEQIEGTSSQFAYTYDNIGRLLTVAKDGLPVEEYRYDNNGNRTYEMNDLLGISGRTFTHSLEDHTLTAGPISYEFDYDDNLTVRREGTETTQYIYSSTGELQRVTLPDNTLIEYINDPLGRRIAKKVNGAIDERYLWLDQTTLLAVYDGSGNLLQRFEYADDRVPYAMTAGGTTYFLAYDQIGSLRLITDNTGNSVKRVEYDSFGNIFNDSNPSFAIPFGFAGGLHDRDAGLVRFGYRDYMPEIGKWTAKDPILFAGGDTNLYGYVANDPVNWVDPWGLDATTWNNTDGGRSRWDGPTNGNWGGKCWSGRQYSCGQQNQGNAPPTDSGDECYKRHDNCYGAGTNVEQCDQNLVNELRNLPDNPGQWPHPPRPGTEDDSRRYRDYAIWYFR